MKRFLISILLFTTVLYGCSSEEVNNHSSGEAVAASGYTDEYSPNPQVPDDRTLLEQGDTALDEKGEVTLIKSEYSGESHEMGPIKLTVHDSKLIHLVPDHSMIDYFHVLTHDEKFDFVKVFVEIENTSDKKVNFAPIALLETNSGERFDWEKDIYLDDLNGEFQAKENKKGNLGFILENSENLEWIEITTSDVFDENEKKILDAKKIRIEL
ncbi:hypothetical protein V1502_16500 [Bacillus sp. SCS-153A]|uniref:hypothetical protein n=1 Tax=Rossellomorea sedimentorum TaxID=3115294 RepID=UPI0039067DD8